MKIIYFLCFILNVFAHYDHSWDSRPNYPDYSWNRRQNRYYPEHLYNNDYDHPYTTTLLNSDCVTPNGESAKCISLEHCSHLRKYGNPRFVSQSFCDHNIEAFVCCGREIDFLYRPRGTLPPPIIITRTPNRLLNTPEQIIFPTHETRRNNPIPIETPISSHPNFNLLPSRDSCGVQNLQDRIFGGNETEIGEFPWMALLEYQINGTSTGFKCGGMLINDRYVLTAAHCVFGTNLPKGEKLFRVRLGEHNLNTEVDCNVEENSVEDCNFPPEDINIEESTIHPGWNGSSIEMVNDIALLRLAQIPKQNDFIGPICLPTNGERSLPGNNLTLCGWGLTENETASKIKMKASVPYIEDNECKRIWARATQISDEQFCAGGSNRVGACSGDSGGPIMSLIPGTTNWYAEGIVSFGRIPCGTIPNIYTRISSYINWILDNIKP